MTNEILNQLIQAIMYAILLGCLIALIVIMGKMEQKAKLREREYIQKLNEHDRAVIMEYKTQVSWVQKKENKK